jgi:hypothetical protein
LGYFNPKAGKPLPKLFGDEPEPEKATADFMETHYPSAVAPRPGQKIGPARRPQQPGRGQGWSKITQPSDPWGQLGRMWELKRRVADGEDYEQVKRELWADQYKGEPDATT